MIGDAVAYVSIVIVAAFFIGMFCGTTKWFDRMMMSIIKFLTGK